MIEVNSMPAFCAVFTRCLRFVALIGFLLIVVAQLNKAYAQACTGLCPEIDKTASVATASEGDTIDYVISIDLDGENTVSNAGLNPFIVTAFTDTIPSGLTYVPSSLSVSARVTETGAVSVQAGAPFSENSGVIGLNGGSQYSVFFGGSPDADLIISYSVTVDAGQTPGSVWTNTANLTLQRTSNSSGVTETENYSDSASVTSVACSALCPELTKSTSDTDVTDGDVFTYTLNIDGDGGNTVVPTAGTNPFFLESVLDVLPNGLSFVGGSLDVQARQTAGGGLTTVAAPPLTFAGTTLQTTANTLDFFFDGTTASDLVISFDVRVDSAPDTGTVFSNRADISLTRTSNTTGVTTTEDLDSTVAVNYTAPPTPVPNTFTKTAFADGTNNVLIFAEVGDRFEYQIVIDADLTSGDYLVRLQDTLPAELSYVGGSLRVVGANNAGLTLPTLADGATGTLTLINDQTLTVGTGSDLILRYDVIVDAIPATGNTWTNAATLTFDSSGDGTIDGADTSLNDDATVTNATSSPVVTTLTKNAFEEGTNTPVTTAFIGQRFDYEITIDADVDSGSYMTRVQDTLPSGLTFVAGSLQVVGVNNTGLTLSSPADGVSGVVSLIPDQAVVAAAGSDVVLRYSVDVDASPAAGSDWINSVLLRFDSSGNGVIENDDDTLSDTATVTEVAVPTDPTPNTPTKTALQQGTSTVITSASVGDRVDFEVVIDADIDTGTYLIRIQDTLPVGMSFVGGSLQVTSANNSGLTLAAPADGSGGAIVLVNDQTLTAAAGSDLILRYSVDVDSVPATGTTWTNTVDVTHDSSGDGTIDGTDTVQTVTETLNDVTAPGATTPNVLTKTAFAQGTNTVIGTAVVGDRIDYEVVINANLDTGTYLVRLQDTLPTGLSYVGGSLQVTSANNAALTLAAPADGVSGVIALINDQTVNAAAGDDVVLRYSVDVDAAPATGTSWTNAVVLTYDSSGDGTIDGTDATLTDSATITNSTPTCGTNCASVTKTSSVTTAQIGDSFTYTIDVELESGVTTLDFTSIVDTLPNGLSFANNFTGPTGFSATETGGIVTITSSAPFSIVPIANVPDLQVSFDVTVTGAPDDLTNWDNVATLNYTEAGTPGSETSPTDQVGYTPLTIADCDCVSLVKSANRSFVNHGETVTYTIALTITDATRIPAGGVALNNFVDTLPAGVIYVPGSASSGGTPLTDTQISVAGSMLTFNGFTLSETGADPDLSISFQAQITDAARTGRLVNAVEVQFQGDNNGDGDASNDPITTLTATAIVRLEMEPVFDCSDIIGAVFDDRNANGVRDVGERGLAGVRLVNTKGLNITTDQDGRYHVPCVATPSRLLGANYILKIVPQSLPMGYSITSENPRVARITRGKVTEINFGARGTVNYTSVTFEIAPHAFAANSTALVPEMRPNIDELIRVLVSTPSSLSLVYNGGAEGHQRMAALSQFIQQQFRAAGGRYDLPITARSFAGNAWSSGQVQAAPYPSQYNNRLQVGPSVGQHIEQRARRYNRN